MATTGGPGAGPGGTFVHTPTTTSGSTSGGGSGGRASRVDLPVSFDSTELVETGISAETSILLSGSNKAFLVSWSKFFGALGYRLFVYRKDANSEKIEEKYIDFDKGAVNFLCVDVEGWQIGSPQIDNAFNVTPLVLCSRKIDINGAANTAHQLPGAYIKTLLKTLGGLADADLNLTSFSDFDTAFPERMKRYIGQQVTIGALVSEIEACAMGYLKADIDGKLGLYLVDQTKAPAETFIDIDIIGNVRGEATRSNTYDRVIVDYNLDPITQKLETVAVDVAEADYKYENNQEFQISSVLIEKVANQRVADAAAAILKAPMEMLTFTVRSKGFVVKVGDIIAITKTRGYTTTESYVADEWFVSQVVENLELAIVELVCLKVWKSPEKFKSWAGASVADWATATATEKATYAYWHDDDNLLGAENTYRNNVWSPR